MDMQGQRTLTATQQQAWAALNDPEVLRACIPGCEKFEPAGDNAYSVTTALKIGPVSARFSGKVQLTDIVPPQSYQLNFDAQGGVAGFGKGQSSVSLHPVDGGCELRYSVHSTVGGKIAQLGQRLIDGAAKTLADDFFKRFEAELAQRHPPVGTAATGTPAKAAADTEAAEKSGGFPAWVWIAGIGLGLALVWFVTR